MTFLVSLGTAVAAAALALLGNFALHSVQSKAKIREERREFVRSLHAETVSVVVDLDMFGRRLRVDALAGTEDHEAIVAAIKELWEDDLLRRVRHVRFGHPDPDVRLAAEEVDDAAWPLIVMARARWRPDPPQPTYSDEKRSAAVKEFDGALQALRRAVYVAPLRDVPDGSYDGSEPPSRIARALAAEAEAEHG